jgi:hypothetical protein
MIMGRRTASNVPRRLLLIIQSENDRGAGGTGEETIETFREIRNGKMNVLRVTGSGAGSKATGTGNV